MPTLSLLADDEYFACRTRNQAVAALLRRRLAPG